MKELSHQAFYISADGDHEWMINQIIAEKRLGILNHLDGLKGELFSSSVLQKFIDEEIFHDRITISTVRNNTLAYSSSGEQRKALLTYIINSNPQYIVVDNVFDSLDLQSREQLLQSLANLSASVLIIQLFTRKEDLLPFISSIGIIKNKLTIDYITRQDFLLSAQTIFPKAHIIAGNIPPPLSASATFNGPLVKMTNVSVQFNGRAVLKNICWEINAGEFWQLKGANGSGKSTLLSLITGNSPKGYGQNLVLFGRKKGSGETVWDIKQHIGYFTPSMTLHFDRQDSAEQMVISGFFDSVGLYLHPNDRQKQLAGEWLAVIGLVKEKHHPFRLLSAGHQRMVLIARAMVKHPPLLILDEPTAGLDDNMASLFVTMVNKIAAETNTAVLYVSHREEPGLSPASIYVLTPGVDGSTGIVQQS